MSDERKLPEWYLAKLRAGGRKGGKRALETMTPEARRERARKAGLAGAAKRRKRGGRSVDPMGSGGLV